MKASEMKASEMNTTVADCSYRARQLEVREKLKALTPEQRSARARDIASSLGLTEVQWVAAGQDRLSSRQLRLEPSALFGRMGELGQVIAITRNDACVHELRGEYSSVNHEGHVILIQGDPIDLRIFTAAIQSIWAVSELGRCSLQFFDRAGRALHKIYCTERTNMLAYQALVEDFLAPANTWPLCADSPGEVLNSSVDQPQVLRRAWLALQDTHEFHGLIRRFKVSRVAAFKAVGTDLAQRIEIEAVEAILADTATRAMPLMCFVANRGAIQIYTGQIHTLYRQGPWYNIIDPSFNLHLNTQAIASAWVVSKPTVDGWVTSVELYDADEGLTVQFFGARKPGEPELTVWRDILGMNCHVSLACCQS